MHQVLVLASFSESLTGFRRSFIQALLNKGLQVHAAAPGLNSKSLVTQELMDMGVLTHDINMARTGMNPYSDLKTLFFLWKLMRQIQPHCILGYTIKPVIYGTLAAWFAKVPKRFALITGLGYAFQESSDKKRSAVKKIAHALYKISLSKCHTVFFQNPDDEKLFRKLSILSSTANTVVVNGSGVTLDEYPLTPVPDYKFPRFLFIGRLLGDKGLREYAEAAHLIKQKYPEVEFDLVGRIDVNPDAITQDELNSWIADQRLNYFGQLKDVKPRIAACSVYVLPSYREGTPRTVLEAMSMGRAIITTDAPGCRETVVNGENGFLVPVKQSQALADAMIKFIQQPHLIKQMAQSSRKLAEDKYDVRKVNREMLKGMGV